MKAIKRIFMASCLFGFFSFSLAVEPGMFRLLSISRSEKLILVSQIPDKTKYLLDATSAKITVDGEAAEFKELKSFSIVQVKFELEKKEKNGIDLDGSAIEIRVASEEELK